MCLYHKFFTSASVLLSSSLSGSCRDVPFSSWKYLLWTCHSFVRLSRSITWFRLLSSSKNTVRIATCQLIQRGRISASPGKRPDFHRGFGKHRVLILYYCLRFLLYHTFLTFSTIRASFVESPVAPFGPSFSSCMYPWWTCGTTPLCLWARSMVLLRLFVRS